ncbi:MAG TPA: hypothetical protein GX747_03035 [Tenericutes bacterium]|nr:hypothetical protein [Mycoplasmatota bacterium]
MKKQNNKIKLLLILFFLLLTTGCTLNYDLVIHTDNRVSESVSFFRNKNDVLKKYSKLKDVKKDEIEKSKINYYKKQYGYSSKYVRSFSGINLIFYKTRASLSDYFEKSIYRSLYTDYELIEIGNTVSFKTVGSYTPTGIFTSENGEVTNDLAKEIKVNIQFHKNVLESNADYIDEFSNTYTWVIKNTDDYKNINFEFGNKKNYIAILYYYIMTNLDIIIILLFLIIIPSIIYLFFKINKRVKNQI